MPCRVDAWIEESFPDEMVAVLNLTTPRRGHEAARRVRTRHAAWLKAQRRSPPLDPSIDTPVPTGLARPGLFRQVIAIRHWYPCPQRAGFQVPVARNLSRDPISR